MKEDQIEFLSPEAMAEMLAGDRPLYHVREAMAEVMRVDRANLAPWCEKKAAEAEREEHVHLDQADAIHVDERHAQWTNKIVRAAHCGGQASAFRAMASMLRGKP